MTQICEERKIDRKPAYHWSIPPHKGEQIKISFPSTISHGKRLKTIQEIFEPIKIDVRENEIQARLKDFKKIIEIEKKLWGMSLEKSSLELCSKLRASAGLPDKYEADETALTDLDSFLADLAGEEVDASEVVRAARRHL